MKKPILKGIRTIAVMTACLAAATPAWAGSNGGSGGSEWQKLSVYLRGVDRYGNLSCYNGGSSSYFCALVNTYDGSFCGSTRGHVNNYSRCFQWYKNVNLFNNYDYDYENGNGYDYVSVRCSLYSVGPKGLACYVACGSLYGNNGGGGGGGAGGG